MYSEYLRRPVVCMTTHDRIDCARINQEIIKINYAEPLPIVHACSSVAYQPYLEETFVRCEPLPLKQGALNLIKQSIGAALRHFDVPYMVHLEGDTWILDERTIYRYIRQMDRDDNFLLCTCSWDDADRGQSKAEWRLTGVVDAMRSFVDPERRWRAVTTLGTQFFIFRNRKAIVDLIMGLEVVQGQSLEATLYKAFSARFGARNLLRMRAREPVHPTKRYQCEELSLFCQHWPARGTSDDPRPGTHPLFVDKTMVGKKEVLERHPGVHKGANIEKLLASVTFDYYNPGAKRY